MELRAYNVTVYSPPTSPFYTVLYANQVPSLFLCLFVAILH